VDYIGITLTIDLAEMPVPALKLKKLVSLSSSITFNQGHLLIAS